MIKKLLVGSLVYGLVIVPAFAHAYSISASEYRAMMQASAAGSQQQWTNPVANPTTQNNTGTETNAPQATSQTTTQIVRPLSVGSKGADVQILQKRLAAEGVYKNDISGYYGPATKEAVKKYQKKYNLTQTGALGPQTLKLINKQAQ